MRFRSVPVFLGLTVVALTAGFGLASCGGGDETSTTPTEATTTETETQTQTATTTETALPPEQPAVIRITVRRGVPVGGIARRSVDKGDRVVLFIRSDVADHVHVHGYDLFRDLVPGRRVRLAFRATVPGRFEIELEDRHVQIAELTVNP